MLLNLTWISLLLLAYVLYVYITNRLKENIIYVGIALFFSVLFFAVDYQISEGYNYLDYYKIEHKQEICDMSTIHSECNTTTYYTFANNTDINQYFAYKDAQANSIKLISQLSLVAFAGFIFAYVYDSLKKWGLIR